MTPKQLTLPVRLGSGMGRRSTLALCWARAMTSWAASSGPSARCVNGYLGFGNYEDISIRETTCIGVGVHQQILAIVPVIVGCAQVVGKVV